MILALQGRPLLKSAAIQSETLWLIVVELPRQHFNHNDLGISLSPDS